MRTRHGVVTAVGAAPGDPVTVRLDGVDVTVPQRKNGILAVNDITTVLQQGRVMVALGPSAQYMPGVVLVGVDSSRNPSETSAISMYEHTLSVGGTQAGDIAWLFVPYGYSGSNIPAGWTQYGSERLWWKVSTGGTVSESATNENPAMFMVVVRNVDPADPFLTYDPRTGGTDSGSTYGSGITQRPASTAYTTSLTTDHLLMALGCGWSNDLGYPYAWMDANATEDVLGHVVIPEFLTAQIGDPMDPDTHPTSCLGGHWWKPTEAYPDGIMWPRLTFKCRTSFLPKAWYGAAWMIWKPAT